MKKEFPKAYDPLSVEDKWYQKWQDNKIYHVPSEAEGKTYCVLMPPPNVTGILHFGHVLNQTLQDIYIRRRRMQGFHALWLPGYDHAGIATQTRVEKQLREEGKSRHDLGREKFLDRVWQWKENYGGIIMKQLRKLGLSCDWDRTLFTMDESASNAVREVFIRLYDEGLIYRGKRIINWSPLSQTALSDEEVEFREVHEHLYTMRYYFEDGENYLKVATVRPETIFGDVAVAVNPRDERYKKYIGQKVRVPVVGRWVPVIADDYADPEFGTGCVKITPAHDPNDFEVGNRHDLPMIATINPDGSLNELTGEFDGMDRFEARKKLVAMLKENELMEKIDDYTHNVGFSQRGGEPVEPFLSDQWFVAMKPLAELALGAVTSGDVKFYPPHWTKTYQHWMENIRDWCISRQLWWGHRIPVYYTEDGRHTAAATEAEARKKLGLGADEKLTQDPDVLDTWFSSWLWPLTTMNWLADGETEDTPELERFLPTDLLVTAPDIIFFWVARMIMATMKFKGAIPFRDVYFTSTIRDGQGRKLSKSLGNSPDPLNIIDKYGTDAVRFTIIYLSPLGQDVKMDVDVKAQDIPSMEIGRNFANKIWNAGRFLLMKADVVNLAEVCPDCEGRDLGDDEMSFADKWILSRYNSTVRKLAEYLDNYKVTEYSKELYEFIWSDFCDWYVEVLKVQLDSDREYSYKQALMRHAFRIYEGILQLLHPVMPFITEEIWHLVGDRSEDESISIQAAPVPEDKYINSEIEDKFSMIQKVVEELRRLRATMNIPPSQKVDAAISVKDAAAEELFRSQSAVIMAMARLSKLDVARGMDKPEGALASVVRQTEVYLIPGEAIDIDKEKERMKKEVERLERNINGSEKKLSNEKFVNNAPENVVAYEREKLDSMKDSLSKVRENLASLGG